MITLSLLTALVSLPAGPSLDGATDTFRAAIIVGNRAGGPGRKNLRYATTDAIAVSETLEHFGRIDRSKLLLDRSAAALDAAITETARKFASRDGQKTLVLYYSGHADSTALLMAGTRYSFRRLQQRLEALEVDLVVVVVDACYSGTLTRAKGARPVAAVDPLIAARTRDRFSGEVYVSSSAASELSHESDQLGGSFFTYHLLEAIRGAADSSKDGRVSLGEAYDYAYHRTVAETAALSGHAQHPSISLELRGNGEVILGWMPPAPPAELHLHRNPRIGRFEARCGVPGAPNLLLASSFESGRPLVRPPNTVGIWGGDLAEVVAKESGVAPLHGSSMLAFRSTGLLPAGGRGLAGQVYQVVSMTPFRELIRTGRARAIACVSVNRTRGGPDTDTEFAIDLLGLFGSPVDFPELNDAGLIDFRTSRPIASDDDPRTWERICVQRLLPPDIDLLAVELRAVENVTDDHDKELDGHFADLACLSVISVDLGLTTSDRLGPPAGPD